MTPLPDEQPQNGTEVFLTMREMLTEVRADLKEVKATMVTKEQHDDHETRIRSVEVWVYGIPLTGIIAVGGVLAALTH
jgi:hypothetical protein